MNENPRMPKTEQPPGVNVKEAWQRLIDNKNDDIENTFCYKLFEKNFFDENLFLQLCNDMDLVLKTKSEQKENYKLLVWIISCIFRSVFSHLDKVDFYEIKNFNEEISEQWGGKYLDKLTDFLTETINVALA